MPHRPKHARRRRRIRSFADLWRALEHSRGQVDGRTFEFIPAVDQLGPMLVIEELVSKSDNKKPGSEFQL